MVKRIFGSYHSEEEALATVTDLQTKGYNADDLLIISNKKTQAVLEDRTEVEVKSSSEGNGGDSFVDKIKRIFTHDDEAETNDTTQNRLVEAGLSEEQAAQYAGEVDEGSILIAADEESAGSTIKPFSDPNLDPVGNTSDEERVPGVEEPTDDVPRATAENPEPSVESTDPSKLNKLDSNSGDKHK